MAITFSPSRGDVLICDFGPNPAEPGTYPLPFGPVSVTPEMIKRRPVVVISSNQRIITVAPFSTAAPDLVRNCHMVISAGTYPFFSNEDNWLKADMLASVSRDRLDRVYFNGCYQRASLSAADLLAVTACVLHGLSLGVLAPHLATLS